MPPRVASWTAVFCLVVLSADAFFLPFAKQTSAKTKTSPYNVLTKERDRNRARYHRYGWPRRKDASVIRQKVRQFTRYLARQAAKTRWLERDFVDHMFNIFDMDRDRVIDKNEFTVILRGLGILPHES